MDETVDGIRDAIPTAVTEAVGMAELAVAVVVVVAIVLALALVRRGRRLLGRRFGDSESDAERSRRRHEQARRREPPVTIGEEYTVAIRDFSAHHSGERHAVAKIEGFVVFVENVPAGCSVADRIRIAILSFNRGKTSATATYLESA